jgi:phosphatidate cytidylyltransferase
MGLIEAGLFVFVAGLVAGIGLYEIVKIGWRKKTTVITGLGLYLLIAFLFIVFAAMADKKYQLLLYTTVLTFDGFSQLSGQLFGKTKLAPKISPGKTIEGLIGGLIFATATAYFIWNEPLQGVIICVAALLGDLLASYYKRKCGVEDYSNLIPGHGGVLDRFDSLIFAGAVCVLIW